MCDCKTRNDVCFMCLDNVLGDINQKIISGTMGKSFISSVISLKTTVVDIIGDDNSNVLKNEIVALRKLQELQQND